MNAFEKRISFCKLLWIAGFILAPVCVGAAIAVGIYTEGDSAWIALPVLTGMAAFFLIVFGFAMGFSYRHFYRSAKTLFTEQELRSIDRPMFLQSFIAEKAKRLMTEGKMKNDMTEFNEFCQLAAIARPGFGGYYGRGLY